MWEMTNMSDVVANEDYPISQGNLWIYNLPIFIFLSVKEGRGNDGHMTDGGTLWGSGITLEENIDTIIACSTNAAMVLLFIIMMKVKEDFRQKLKINMLNPE